MKNRLLVCDMDGTLLNKEREVSEENLLAINRFVDAGGLFTVATGRMRRSVKEFREILPINAPTILYNGAVIHDFDNEENIYQSFLNEKAESILKSVMDEFPEAGVEVYSGDNVYFAKENKETDDHLRREPFAVIRTSIDNIPKPWIKVLIAWDPVKIKQIEVFLKDYKGVFRTVYSEPEFLEWLDLDTSKGHALLELSKITGIDMENIVTVGDNLNDKEMIEVAGIGVAVSNANEKVKKSANFIAKSNIENAIAQIIECIEKNNWCNT